MNIDLKALRQRAGLTQSQLAEALEHSQSQISRYEKRPDDIPFGLMQRWLAQLGVHDPAPSLIALPPALGLDVGAPYADLARHLDAIDIQLQGALGTDVDEDAIAELKQLLGRARNKPNLVLAGRTDAGKSTLANSLLGTRLLPNRYQPTTRLETHVRHIDDRPPHLAYTTYLLGKRPPPSDDLRPGQRNGPLGSEPTLDGRRILAIGDHKSLSSWTHGDADASATDPGALGVAQLDDAERVVVYSDAPLLSSCQLIDLPGFRAGADAAQDDDGRSAQAASAMADAVLYASTCTSFMDPADLEYLALFMRALPHSAQDTAPMGNLLIVGTHAGPHVGDVDVDQLLSGGAQTLWRHFGETLFPERDTRIEEATVRARMLPFFEEMPARRGAVHEAVGTCLREQLPAAVKAQIRRDLRGWRDRQLFAIERERSALTQARDRRIETDKARAQAARGASLREAARHEELRRLLLAMEESRTTALGGLERSWASRVDVDAIEELVRLRYQGPSSTQDARRLTLSAVVELLRHDLLRLDQEQRQRLGPLTARVLHSYALDSHADPGAAFDRLVQIPFDERGALAGGLGLLVGMALGFAGGVVLMLGGLLWSIFGESWQRRLAKRVAGKLDSSDLRQRWARGLEDLWRQREAQVRERTRAAEAKLRVSEQRLQAMLDGAEVARAEWDRRLEEVLARRGRVAAVGEV